MLNVENLDIANNIHTATIGNQAKVHGVKVPVHGTTIENEPTQLARTATLKRGSLGHVAASLQLETYQLSHW